MKKIEKVDIVLENCEYYSFNPKDILVLLDGLGRHFFSKLDFKTAEHCYINISKNAKPINELEDWQEDWQTRIERDITQVHIGDEAYHVKWSDRSEYENDYQTDIETPQEKIYIISKTRKTPEDF